MSNGHGTNGGRTRAVNRRPFTRRGGDETLPPWWPGMVAVVAKMRRAESTLERARRDRDKAVWLAVRHRGASVRWLARRIGCSPTTVLIAVQAGDEAGYDETEVTRDLNLAARTRATRERLLRDEEGRRITDAWSAPGPPESDL